MEIEEENSRALACERQRLAPHSKVHVSGTTINPASSRSRWDYCHYCIWKYITLGRGLSRGRYRKNGEHIDTAGELVYWIRGPKGTALRDPCPIRCEYSDRRGQSSRRRELVRVSSRINPVSSTVSLGVSNYISTNTVPG